MDRVVDFITVTAQDQIRRCAHLAHCIWNEHFPNVISQAQIDYMVERFQNETAIARQIAEGCTYVLIQSEQHDAGYYAVQPEPEGTLFLSKLYVLESYRGQGLGRAALAHIETQCRCQGQRTLRLVCNKRNTGPIAAYQRMGFQKTAAVVTDIGEGFVMDDYQMEKRLTDEG